MANSVSMATALTNRVPTNVDVTMGTNCHQMAPTAWVNINHFVPIISQAKFAEELFYFLDSISPIMGSFLTTGF